MRNFKISLLFTLFVSTSILAQSNSFDYDPAKYGGWDCNDALDGLNKNSNDIKVTSWIFGYIYAKKIQFIKGESPVSKTGYNDFLVPYLVEYCENNQDSPFYRAMDSYVDFKLKKGEAIIDN